MDAASPDSSDHAADHADDAAEESTDAAGDAVEAETVEAEAEAPPKTLLQALGDTTNRDVARQFAAFSSALAFLPILGLFASEYLLSDSNSRWMYSAIVAVISVNLVLAAFVVHCFAEGFPDAPAAPVKGAAQGPGQGAGEASAKAATKSQTDGESEQNTQKDEAKTETEAKKEK